LHTEEGVIEESRHRVLLVWTVAHKSNKYSLFITTTYYYYYYYYSTTTTTGTTTTS